MRVRVSVRVGVGVGVRVRVRLRLRLRVRVRVSASRLGVCRHAREVQRRPQPLVLHGVHRGALGDQPGEQLAVGRHGVHSERVVQRVAPDGVHLVLGQG